MSNVNYKKENIKPTFIKENVPNSKENTIIKKENINIKKETTTIPKENVNPTKKRKKKDISLLTPYETKPTDCTTRIEASLKAVFFTAFSLLSALTIRDLLTHLITKVASESEMKKTTIMFLYTFGILLVTVWIIYIWS